VRDKVKAGVEIPFLNFEDEMIVIGRGCIYPIIKLLRMRY